MTDTEETKPALFHGTVTEAAEWRETPDGFHELVNKDTGEILMREKQSPLRDQRWDRVVPRRESRESKHLRKGQNKEPAKHRYIHDAKGNLVWVPTDVHPDVLRAKYPKSKATFDIICKLVIQGKTLKQIARKKGMPPIHVLYTWIQDPDFRPLWLAAKNGRSEVAADVVVEMATAPPVHKEVAAGARVKMEAAKWVAETGNREDYGRSTKITGDANAPIAIVVSTGIDRDPIPVDVTNLPPLELPEELKK